MDGHQRLFGAYSVLVRRWLFADQLGPHFLDDTGQPVLLVESKAVFRRRAFHRQKAHLILSALRHRAAELGEQAEFHQTLTYRQALDRLGEPVDVCHPTTRRARDFVRTLREVTIREPRGFITSQRDFVAWADAGHGRLRMDGFYRYARQHHGVLMDGDQPAGGLWSLEGEGRHRPPRGVDRLDVPAAPSPVEDEIDERVRYDLDRWEREGIRFVGRDGPRLFPATRAEALDRLRHFIEYRLPSYGPYQDAMLTGDPFLAHSQLSAAVNLGLLAPLEVVRAAEAAYWAGAAPLASAEGFIRQLLGWRDYVWHLYWYFEADRPEPDRPARKRLPDWFEELDADAVEARCLNDVLAGVRDRGWVHHIPRLMVLGNYALQRGWRPEDLADWFHRCFVDGHRWAMVVNVVGMSEYADLGALTTRPYADGGYINRMSDYCGGCRYEPGERLGANACPYTAGYWSFLAGARDRLGGNPRLVQDLRRLDRLKDLDDVRDQERRRGTDPP